MNSRDYRCNEYTYKKLNLQFLRKKKNFEKQIGTLHPKIKNFYINVKRKEFSDKFRAIYNDSCAYCGLSIYLVPKSDFEIDHVLPKSIANDNGLYNLVCACKFCNRKKSHFLCKKKDNQELLHPDKDHLQEIFYRDSDYYIRIVDTYRMNEDVKKFYEKLELNYENKRLEYLILEIKDFCEVHSDDEVLLKLRVLLDLLREKWNCQV